MNFVAGRGLCLSQFAVTQIREMLNRREERQLDGVLAAYANDIATMRSLMASSGSASAATVPRCSIQVDIVGGQTRAVLTVGQL